MCQLARLPIFDNKQIRLQSSPSLNTSPAIGDLYVVHTPPRPSEIREKFSEGLGSVYIDI